MEIIEPIFYIAISQTFFAALLVATIKPLNIANKLMASFLFMVFFDLLFALIKLKFIVFYSFPFIAFTYGPILFLYVEFMTKPGLKFDYRNLLHFIPFIVFFAASVIFRSDKAFTNFTGYLLADKFISVRIAYGLCFFLSISVYSILTFIRISNHQKRLKDLLSYESNKLTLSWLKIISISFYAMYVVLFILGGITLFFKFLPFDPYYTVFVFIAIFSFVYGFYAVKQPVLVGVVIKKTTNNENEADEVGSPIIIPVKEGVQKKDKSLNGRYSKSGLKADKAKKILDQLILFMEVKKPYLDRDLSIYQLSNLTGISRHYITEVLNELHGQNFFTFVNEYRVNEVIRRLNDPANSNFTILAIAYDSGFNSKSTFNTIFKQLTGLTPSLYLAKIKKEN
ncbi:MAG: AraC family transcriptional regulator [Bacteroidales bacterium]|nr:AraC family transcriptional regulator [Bacteroidales bacterium]